MSPECCKASPYIITHSDTFTCLTYTREHTGGLNCSPSSPLKHVSYASINPMLHLKTLLRLHMRPHLEHAWWTYVARLPARICSVRIYSAAALSCLSECVYSVCGCVLYPWESTTSESQKPIQIQSHSLWINYENNNFSSYRCVAMPPYSTARLPKHFLHPCYLIFFFIASLPTVWCVEEVDDSWSSGRWSVNMSQ